jgi:transcriptional regulator with XRE-family HTH domain
MTGRTPEELLLLRLRTLIPDRQARIIAKRAGISEGTLSRWRSGALKPNPKLTTLVRLAAVLKVPLAHLISDGQPESDLSPLVRDRIEKLAADAEISLAELRKSLWKR